MLDRLLQKLEEKRKEVKEQQKQSGDGNLQGLQQIADKIAAKKKYIFKEEKK